MSRGLDRSSIPKRTSVPIWLEVRDSDGLAVWGGTVEQDFEGRVHLPSLTLEPGQYAYTFSLERDGLESAP